MSETPTHITIVGAGLAGTLCAEALVERGAPPDAICLVDAAESADDGPSAPVAPRASDTPAALLHPFPGRSLEDRRGRLRYFAAALEAARRWRERYDAPVHDREMVRPVTPDRRGERLRTSYLEARDGYPPWLIHEHITGRGAIAARYPHLDDDISEVISYRPAFVVELRATLEVIRQDLVARGVELRRDEVRSVVRRDESLLVLARHARWQTDRVVLAAGRGLAAWFPDAGLAHRHGEVMLGAPPEDAPPLAPIISSGGYVAPLPDRRWLVGSTYLGDEELEGRTERDARDQLREHVGRITPAVERTTSVDVWRGTRTHLTDDHLPTVGDVPGYHGRVFVLGALGSKGLLRAPLLASRLAESLLVSPAQKYENSSLSRLSDMRWFSPRLTQSEPGLEADRG